MGRPTKLTEVVKNKIISAVKKGAFINTSCASAGIDNSTYYVWQNKANEGIEPYKEFFSILKGIESDNEIALTEKWQEKINEDSAHGKDGINEYMRRRFKKNWNVDNNVKVEGTIEHTFASLISDTKDNTDD